MSSWPSITLDDVFEIARGGSPRPIEAYITDDVSGINWIMIGDASEGSKYITGTRKRIRPEGASRSRSVKSGDFLLTNSMSFGKPYILRTDGCIHDGWLVLSPRKDDVDRDFFYYLLGSKAVYAEFARRAAGATVKNLNIDLVKGVKVAVPPLVEQRRIAATLDRAEELRTKRFAALTHLDHLAEAIFLDMFGDPRLNPHDWKLRPLKELGVVRTGGTPSSAKSGMFDGPIPFVTPGDLESKSAVKRSLTVDGAAEVGTVRAGSTLVCCIGTIGKMAKVLTRSAFNQQINAIEWTELVDDDFGLAALRFLKPQIARWGSSTTVPILKKSLFEQIELPVPPLELQHDFRRRVSKVEALKDAQRKALAELNVLFGSLQDRAFRGEL